MINLKDQILKKFRTRWKDGNDTYVNAQKIEDWVHANILHPKKKTQYKHETIGRCLRSLCEQGQLTQQYEGTAQSVAYRYAPNEHETLSLNMKQKLLL